MDYKRILEGVVNIINNTKKSDIGFTNICAYIGENCPELKESKDEKIRKEMINWLQTRRYSYIGNVLITNAIAWLEKQGDLVKYYEDKLDRCACENFNKGYKKALEKSDKIQLGKKYKCIASPRYSTFTKGCIYQAEDKFLCSLMNFCSDCFEPVEEEIKRINK